MHEAPYYRMTEAAEREGVRLIVVTFEQLDAVYYTDDLTLLEKEDLLNALRNRCSELLSECQGARHEQGYSVIDRDAERRKLPPVYPLDEDS